MNSVPTSPLADDLATAPSGLVQHTGLVLKKMSKRYLVGINCILIWIFYLMIHSTHLFFTVMCPNTYGSLRFREETSSCCHMGYSFQLAARVLLDPPPHRQDSIYHRLCYTHGPLAEWEITWWVHHEGSIQQSVTPYADALPWNSIRKFQYIYNKIRMQILLYNLIQLFFLWFDFHLSKTIQ